MSENLYMKHKTFHTKTCVFTAPDAHITHLCHITYNKNWPARERERGGGGMREGGGGGGEGGG